MPTKKLTVYDRIHNHLYDEANDTPLNEADYKVKLRVQTALSKKLDLPTITDRTLAKLISNTFGVSLVTAYADINAAERIYGNIRKSSKEYIRALVSETQKHVINIELSRLNDVQNYNQKASVKDKIHYSTQQLTSALSVLARANNLDKEDPDLPNWDDVQPPIIEPSDDITTIDLEPIEKESVERLREKYMGKMQKINEARND